MRHQSENLKLQNLNLFLQSIGIKSLSEIKQGRDIIYLNTEKFQYLTPVATLFHHNKATHIIGLNPNDEFPLNSHNYQLVIEENDEPNIQYNLRISTLSRDAELLGLKIGDKVFQKKYQDTAITHEETHLRINVATQVVDAWSLLTGMHSANEVNPETKRKIQYHLSYENIISEWLTNTITALTTDHVVILNHIISQLNDLSINDNMFFEFDHKSKLNLIEHTWTAINTNQVLIPTNHIHAIAFIMGDPNIFEKIKKQKNTKKNKAKFAKEFLKKLEEFVDNPTKYLKKIITPQLIEILFKKEKRYSKLFKQYIVENSDKLCENDIKYLKLVLSGEQLQQAIRKTKEVKKINNLLL